MTEHLQKVNVQSSAEVIGFRLPFTKFHKARKVSEGHRKIVGSFRKNGEP